MANNDYESSSRLAEIMDAKICTPSDTVNCNFGTKLCNRLWVGVAGTITFVRPDGSTVQFAAANLAVGVKHDMFPFIRINSTGTTATGIIVGTTF